MVYGVIIPIALRLYEHPECPSYQNNVYASPSTDSHNEL